MPWRSSALDSRGTRLGAEFRRRPNLRCPRADRGNRIVEQPERVRLSVRRGMAPPAGAFIETKAQLNPPRQPLRPGSYDFARDLYFQRIGALGFVHGAIKVVTPPEAASLRMRASAFI